MNTLGQVDSLSNTTQEGHMIEDAAVNEDSFTAKLTSGNLDKKTHGLVRKTCCKFEIL